MKRQPIAVPRARSKNLIAALLLGLLAACGGGGGSSSNGPTTTPAAVPGTKCERANWAG